ncbi:MAG: CHAT domain-containing protein [Actinobacteria bacterium]|nr:CHAT domain-containing protein [Actinomycetota bacterium]MBI3687595.1 CHAT domain-containing protein [Actinomycetota bacterium]
MAGRLLTSLAHAEAELGNSRFGLRLLDEAAELLTADDRGVLLQQRALILMRAGRSAEAVALFDRAVPLLGHGRHCEVLARTLLNRAVLHLTAGRVGPAREDLGHCRRLAGRHGLPLVAAKALHNLGCCDHLAGDIPAALSAFELAEDAYRQWGAGFLPVLRLDRARALLAAGLAIEAGAELDGVQELFRRQRLSQDHAEAELTRAVAALLAGDPAAARRWAGRAQRRFLRRGNQAWAALAELLRLRAAAARPAAGAAAARPAARAAAAAELADRLVALGLPIDAELAGWLSVRALVAAGRPAEAADRAATLPARPTYSLELRLVGRLGRAELALAGGRRSAAFTQLRAGLATLQEHRSRFGSLDLQVGVASLGVELAEVGLAAALDAGSPRLVFDWVERARAQAFRIRPVRPPPDPQVAEALAELRQLRWVSRQAELTGGREPAALRRCAELERLIRARSWQVRGTGRSSAVTGLRAVATELDQDGKAMVTYASHRGQLIALVVRAGQARLFRLAGYAAVAESTQRLLSDLDALAGRRLPARMESVIMRSLASQLDALARDLVAPVAAALGDGELVLAPTMALASLPWGLLPPLAGRPVSVVPSASSWLSARRAARAEPASPPGPAVLVAGPGLPNAAPEIRELARIYPGGRQLVGAEATVGAVTGLLDGASVAHLATHGHHDRENVLFSRLDLADGPLMAYDVQQLAVPPRLAVLSACDVGRSVVRPGDELLGFTAALLYTGTPTVIAGVSRVPDEAAVPVMTAFHRARVAGAGPARALAEATQARPLTPFVCFGEG